jgi:hypothetical protein
VAQPSRPLYDRRRTHSSYSRRYSPAGSRQE